MSVQRTRLANLCEVITKGTTPTTLGFNFVDDGVFFLRVQNIEDGRVFYDRDPLYIDEQTHRALGRSQIKPGDILVSIAGTIGRTAVVPENAPALNCNQAVAIVRTNGQISRYFLRHWLESPDAQAQMRGATVTGTISNLSLTQIGTLQIPLPPLTEQRRLAVILDHAEALRAKRRHALAKLDTLTQSLFLDIFGKPMVNERGWTMSKVDEAGRVQLGRQRAPQYQTGKFTRPYVRVANIFEDRIDLSDLLSMDFDDNDFLAYSLEHGDILLNEGQSTELVGRPAMWRSELANCCFQNTLIRFQPERRRVIPEFALAVFLHYFRTGEFARISSSTVFMG
jgi:type I restriction enzyme S subunit